MSVNLAKYKKRILAKEDKLLFTEVEKCAKAGAYRAAYILTWIACAESFKRRFREASKRDGLVGPIVGHIKTMEGQKKSVDGYLLTEAEKYGFIDAAVKAKLDNVYTFRCMYAHPYEDAPKQEELLNAVCIVVDHVLSQPVRLKEGFISSQIKEIFSNKNFLDDLQAPVEAYATEILPRISEDCYEYMLNALFKEIDKIGKDASLGIYTRRGAWISWKLIELCLPKFPKSDWHGMVNNHPDTAPLVLSPPNIFDGIGKKAQDSLIGHILSAASQSPSVLIRIEKLLENGSLSDRHKERFFKFIDKFEKPFYGYKSADKLKASGLKLKTCFSSVICHLKSRDWYTQNPIASMISGAGPSQIHELGDAEQEELGRNILQSSDGSASDASALLVSMSENANTWSYHFIYGILVECFVNEENQFRFKIRKLNKVCEILETLEEEHREPILDTLLNEIEKSEIKRGDEDDLKECIEVLKSYKWSKKFSAAFEKLVSKKIKDKAAAKKKKAKAA